MKEIQKNQLYLAYQLFESGKLKEAERTCRKLIKKQPSSMKALHLLGIILYQRGKLREAEKWLSKTLVFDNVTPEIVNSFGLVLMDLHKYEKAKDIFQRVIVQKADYGAAYNNLGAVLQHLGRHFEAAGILRKAQQLLPGNIEVSLNYVKALDGSERYEQVLTETERILEQDTSNAEAWYLNGLGHEGIGDDKAEESYRRALQSNPGCVSAANNLGALLLRRGDRDSALKVYRGAIGCSPKDGLIYRNYAKVLLEAGRYDEALESFQAAISLLPDDENIKAELAVLHQKAGDLDTAEKLFCEVVEVDVKNVIALSNLAVVLEKKGRYRQALELFERSISLQPENPALYYNYGNALHEQGRIEEALKQYEKSLDLAPEDVDVFSNYLFTQNYSTGLGALEIFQNHVRFGKVFEESGLNVCDTLKDRLSENKKLRIGYVSPDFRDHAVAYFIEPVFRGHNRGGFEVYCYYTNIAEDDVTRRLRKYDLHWRSMEREDYEKLVKKVEEDQIDILVDLTGHTGNNSLLGFIRRPAPVQVTWLGYLNTTGLASIDYRITDANANPEGCADELHTEKLIRLPGCQWCYQPPEGSPEIGPSPCLARGYITFASFHNLSKLTDPVINVWSRVLLEIPGSKLMIIAKGLEVSPEVIVDRFKVHGIGMDRLDVRGRVSFNEYLEIHKEVDINLDAFPYTGGTTTFHSLWMGVPVLTLSSDTVVGKGGVSILRSLGLDEFIAYSENEYLDKARSLSENLQLLTEVRGGLRQRLETSDLTNEKKFCKNIENEYLKIWKAYLKTR